MNERERSMLIVAVVFEFVPGGFDRIKAEVVDAVENSRKEPGAQIYDWAIDVTAPNRAIIFEVWDDQAALDAHFTHPYMDTLVAALSAANIRGDITHYSAEIYDVTGKRDMGFRLPTE
ncbi:MAG: putative quinol monooxygenase [Rhodospirillaceae bacterium]|nr:putative quinol monooxygenase [Rhodospirillaceae bacterium]